MQITILERDVEKATAKIQFVHNNVTFVDKYNLLLIIPGTEKTLKDQGQTFTEEMQNTVISRLTEQVQREIEQGIIVNRL